MTEKTAGSSTSDHEALVLRLAEGIRHWTEDSDRCDMEGREDEVARYLIPIFQAGAPAAGGQTLEQFVEWFRNDLAYKAPETWPRHVSWFLNTLVHRYGSTREAGT